MNRSVSHLDGQMNIFSEDTAKQAFNAADVLVDIDNARLQDLLAAKRQQLSRQRCAALRGLQDMGDQSCKFRIVTQFVEKHFRIARNDAQNIVKIVRDPAREASDRFHLLNMPEAMFHAAPMRNILGRYLEVEELSISVREGAPADFHGNALAIFAPPVGLQARELFAARINVSTKDNTVLIIVQVFSNHNESLSGE